MKKVLFILDQFDVPSPGQQLLDRFLIGLYHQGEFRPSSLQVSVWLPNASVAPALASRVKDFGLQIAPSREAALRQADAALILLSAQNENTPKILEDLLPKLSRPFFIDGHLLPVLKLSQRLSLPPFSSQSIAIAISTAAAHLIPLPVKPVFAPDKVSKALITVQGPFPGAEIDAAFALLPCLETSLLNGGIGTIRKLQGPDLWNALYSADWRPLLAAAISRSNTIQGDPEKDGRPQDIVGLRLLEKLAENARGWFIEKSNGMRMAILVLDGALADTNFAVEAKGQVHSAQLYRPPAPLEGHYGEFAFWIRHVLEGPRAPDPLRNALFVSGLLDKMAALDV